jgi:hypothetical protein
MSFGYFEPANFVLQSRALQSEPFCRSPFSCDSPGGRSQSINNYRPLSVMEGRGWSRRFAAARGHELAHCRF